MKKILSLLAILLIITSLTACGGKNEIPNVFGIDYNDAISVLEAEGYEVKAVSTSVGSISERLLYPLEKADEGTVIKIDDYVLDNNGNLTNNYDIIYGDKAKMTSDDKSVVIYYAKEDYVLVKESESGSNTPTVDDPTDISEPDTTEPENGDDTSAEPDDDKKDDTADGLDAEFKAAMDGYEAFMNEYVEFMKKYKANPTDLGLIVDYTKYISDYAKFTADFAKWDGADMNAAETAYYIEVQARVSKKLLEAAY